MDLTKEALIEVLEEMDVFAVEALSAYIHKSAMWDQGEGRFQKGKNFMDAVRHVQSKVRIVLERIHESKDFLR